MNTPRGPESSGKKGVMGKGRRKEKKKGGKKIARKCKKGFFKPY